MLTLHGLTALLGWALLINAGLLLLSTWVLTRWRGGILPLHSRLFGIAEEDLKRLYLNYLALYKVLIIIFNLTPYLALRLLAAWPA